VGKKIHKKRFRRNFLLGGNSEGMKGEQAATR